MRTANREPSSSLFILLGALLVSGTAHAVGEQNGRIGGVITDAQTKAPLPGATIRVSSPELPGGPRTVSTDDDGRYEIVELPPGTYDVELSYSGVRPLRRRVVVRQGELLPLSIAWSVELLGVETTVIIEERHMTRPDSTQTGTVLTKDTQARVASGRRYQDIVQQAAGVSGASLTGSGGNPNVKGGLFNHNRYLVDGLDITDPVTNTFSANINFDSLCSVEVLTGGMEAQYNSLGGIINLNTCAGSSEWQVDSSFYMNHVKLSLGQQYGPQLHHSIRPFSTLEPPPSQTYQANLNVGGPILKKHLWFNFSFEYLFREAANPAGPPLNVQHPPLNNHRFLTRLKLTYAPNARHRVTLSASADPAFFNNINVLFNSGNYLLPVAEDRQNQGGVFTILQWDAFVRQNMNTSLQAGFQYSTIDYGPQGHFGSISFMDYGDKFSARNNVYDPGRPQHVNSDDGTIWYQGSSIFIDRRYTAQLDPSVSLRGRLLGSHDAKIGLQTRFVFHTAQVSTPGGRVYNDAGGGPGEAGLCDHSPALMVPEGMRTGSGCYQYTDQPDYSNRQWGVSAGLFVQDRWKPLSWLMVLPGLRFDYGYTVNSQGERVSSLWGFGPRLGINVDLTRDQKTILSAFYGRSNEVLSLLAASSADVSAVYTTYQFNADMRRFDKAYESGGPGGYRIDPHAKTPHADEVTLSFRREVFQNSMAGVDYTYKRLSNVWDSVEINQIWDPTGTRVLRYANGKEQQIFLYTTPDENYRNYHGVDFIVEGRPTANWDIFAAYTLSFLYGPGSEQLGQIAGQNHSQFYNPRLYHLFDGFLREDQRHQLKLRISYNWKGLNAGMFMNYTTGRPRTKLYFNQTDGSYTLRRSPQGTEPGDTPNDPQSITEFRFPDLITVDARISVDLHWLIRQHVILIADIFNVFNLGAATDLEARDVPNYGQVRGRQPPLRFQLGVRYLF